jgi:hypothetical protein
MEAIYFSDTSVDTQWITRRYISEDGTLHNHRCENLKFDKKHFTQYSTLAMKAGANLQRLESQGTAHDHWIKIPINKALTSLITGALEQMSPLRNKFCDKIQGQ